MRILAEIMIFSEIHKIYEILPFSTFSLKSIKKFKFHEMVPDGAQGTKKGMEFHWLNKVFRLPAAKVRKSHICGKS